MGHWGEKISIFSAFTSELQLINQMAELMGKPPLFRNSYEEGGPRDFGFLLRPTLTEFNSFILLLDKMMSDNLNKKFFKADLELEEEHQRADGKIEVRQKGTIALLDEWIRKYFRSPEPEPIDRMMGAFKEVRKLRQRPAHASDENVFDQEYVREQRRLIMDSYSAIRTLRMVLANHPAVQENPPSIRDLLARGEIWSF